MQYCVLLSISQEKTKISLWTWRVGYWTVRGITWWWCHTATSVSFLIFHRCYPTGMKAMILIHGCKYVSVHLYFASKHAVVLQSNHLLSWPEQNTHMSEVMHAIFKLLQLCGETRMFSGVDGCVLHLILPGCLSECSWAIPMHTSEYLITKNLNVYFHKVFYAGESENKGL